MDKERDKELKGQRSKNASGRESYGIFEAQPEYLETIAALLSSRFGFAQQGETGVGLIDVIMTFTNGTITLAVGWDSWSGCYIMAQQPAGDEVVRAIGDYLDTLLKAS